MEPVTSVAAFVLLHEDSGGQDEPADVFACLDSDEKLALRAWQVEPARRLDWLRRNSDGDWTQTKLEHVEAGAMLRLRRELQRRGLWQS